MAEMRFADRRHAGTQLGARLVELEPANPLVLALPRGGVPVGYEVARALSCDLDVLLVRKLGLPGQPELAMGAVAEGGLVIRNPAIIELAGVDEEEFQSVLRAETETLARRAADYRADHPPLDPVGHTALVVDDGLATGSTALAAIEALRERGVGEIWMCAPVGPSDTVEAMGEVADRMVVLYQPRHFGAVGAWYRDFGQTDDAQVRVLLARSRLR
jgi:putative phosphoribosyl transferase